MIFWANFERLLPFLPRDIAARATDDLRRAADGIPAHRILVANRVYDTLAAALEQVESPAELAQVPPGMLFEYFGSMGTKGMKRDARPGTRARVTVPRRKRKGLQFVSEPRLDHTLTSSIDTMNNAPSSCFVVGFREHNREDRFTSLLLGVRAWDFSPYERNPYRTQYPSVAAAARDAILAFTSQVERQGKWRVLHQAEGKPADERAIQLAFELSCHTALVLADVSVDPQADHGAGAVDLCLSRGNESVCIELKRRSHPRYSTGATVQLPAYMSAKGATRGHFVLVYQQGDPDDVVEQAESLEAMAPEGVEVHVVDGRPKKSASQRR